MKRLKRNVSRKLSQWTSGLHVRWFFFEVPYFHTYAFSRAQIYSLLKTGCRSPASWLLLVIEYLCFARAEERHAALGDDADFYLDAVSGRPHAGDLAAVQSAARALRVSRPATAAAGCAAAVARRRRSLVANALEPPTRAGLTRCAFTPFMYTVHTTRCPLTTRVPLPPIATIGSCCLWELLPQASPSPSHIIAPACVIVFFITCPFATADNWLLRWCASLCLLWLFVWLCSFQLVPTSASRLAIPGATLPLIHSVTFALR